MVDSSRDAKWKVSVVSAAACKTVEARGFRSESETVMDGWFQDVDWICCRRLEGMIGLALISLIRSMHLPLTKSH